MLPVTPIACSVLFPSQPPGESTNITGDSITLCVLPMYVCVCVSFSRLISSNTNTQVAALGLATMPSEGKVRNLINCFNQETSGKRIKKNKGGGQD